MIELTGKYTKATIYADTVEEGVFSQVYDIINSPAFEGQSVVCMPDVHVGASGPCGLVATIGDYVCPEHIGVDIGCSVSMMVLDKKIPQEKFAEFEHKVKTKVPFGFNINDSVVIDEKDFYRFLTKGFNKYASVWPEMLRGLPNVVTEKWVSDVLQRIGMDEGMFYKSLGSVGGGNHFVEYDESDDLGGVTLHFGSRNFGVKVCKYWMNVANKPVSGKERKEMTAAFKKEYMKSHDSMEGFNEALKAHLATATEGKVSGYLHGDEMRGYLCDMAFAQLYAQYNHKTVQDTIKEILRKYNISVAETYTSVHNFIDLEDHVLRKSAIRAYKGETILVPFNMRDGIAICEGKSNEAWINSCSHGAGRRMSRSEAKKTIDMEDFKKSMDGIYSTTVCMGTIDESPMAYKDTDEIIRLIQDTCDVRCMMKPRINIKTADLTD